MDNASEGLQMLRSHAEQSLRRGMFLLSTTDVSDFWIDINEFITPRAIEAMALGLASFAARYSDERGPFGLVTPAYPDASEKSFPLRLIVESAIEKCGGDAGVVSIGAEFRPGDGTYELDQEPPRICVPVIGVSVHISVLLGVISAVRRTGVTVDHAFAFLCREKTSVGRLRDVGVTLVPLLIAEEITGRVASIADAEVRADPDFATPSSLWGGFRDR